MYRLMISTIENSFDGIVYCPRLHSITGGLGQRAYRLLNPIVDLLTIRDT